MAISLRPGDRLVLATHNPGKLRELEELFGPHGLMLDTAGALGLPEPDETGTTFHANAALKAHAAARATGRIALADDSGIVVHGLDGQPGVYSARWAGPDKDFGRAMRRVVAGLAERHGGFAAADKRATFVAVLCLAAPDGAEAFFEGRTDGEIVEEPRGTGGFGYDPIFRPDGEVVTFAEMSPQAKRALSHRARALRALTAALFPA